MRAKMRSKKILSLIVATLMILTMLPVSTFADEQASDDVMIEEYADEVTVEAAEVDSEVVEEAAEVPEDAVTNEAIFEDEANDVAYADLSEDFISDVVIEENNDSRDFVVGAGDAPATSKKLHDNGDGTYTLSLSVTGKASSTSTTEVDKANVILILDTSSSMNNGAGDTYYTVEGTPLAPTTANWGRVTPTFYRPNGTGYSRLYYRNNAWRQSDTNTGTIYNGTFYTNNRLAALKHALTDTEGIIDKLLEQNVPSDDEKKDIIEVAIVDFNTDASTLQGFTTSASALKTAVNGLGTGSGTNWEAALDTANTLATNIKNSQSNEPVYVIFLTDGQPTDPTGNVDTSWDRATDDARKIVDPTGCEFYALFAWGDGNNEHYLSSLVQYAYTGSGTNNTPLDDAYKKYYSSASDTASVIAALTQVIHSITNSVGYTNVELTDGVTEMTASSVKASTSGTVSGIKYYRSGGDYGTADPDNGNYGTEWTEAPEASINDNGEVDWDLDDYVLEDGVTYTMTFVVWPAQESLDLVADLNNGVIAYSDLTAEEQAQIHQSADGYTLKTNTDYPTVTYSTITTMTVDGVTTSTTSDPVTSNITNPSPVGLTKSRLNAKKEWEDTLDPSQREEIEDVLLYLKVGGEYYYKDKNGNPIGVTLTEESNWTETDYIFIAPGLLVTSDSPAYDPTAPHFEWDNKTYAMLEEGHEYEFEESEINNHYELIAYKHHPMIMGYDENGKAIIKDVTFKKDAAGNITGIESVDEMGDNISATNILKGGINISKKVVDMQDSTKELDVDDPFEVIVNMTDTDGNALPTKETDGTQYTIDYRIYYGEKNPEYEANIVYEEDGTTIKYSRSPHKYVTGTSFTETLYVGDVIRVVNVEEDALFNVSEDLDAGSSYEMDSVDYTIAYGTENAEEYEQEDIVVKDKTNWYPMKGNSACNAVVINKCVPFYVYHSGVSGDGNLETVAVPKDQGTYDLTQNVTENTLYGGYYLNYAGKGTYADDGVKGKNGVAYTGMNYDWSATSDQVQTVSGKAMTPTPRETYYIKEVPVYYLLNYYQLNYMKTDEQRLMSMYLISAIDDLNYKETGFTITQDNEKAKVASSVTFQNAATGNKVKLMANTVFKAKGITGNGSEKDKLTYYDLTPNTKFFKADSSFSVKPYWITPDGITVNGVSSREIKIETLTRKGVTKIDK